MTKRRAKLDIRKKKKTETMKEILQESRCDICNKLVSVSNMARHKSYAHPSSLPPTSKTLAATRARKN